MTNKVTIEISTPHNFMGSRWGPTYGKLSLEFLSFTESRNCLYLGHTLACSACGEYFSPYSLDGKTIANPPSEECPLEAGEVTSIIIDVPSGKIAVADSLPGIPNDIVGDYNSWSGQIATIKHMAEKYNVAEGPVGNSCPTLYKTSGGFVIANVYWDDEDQEHELLRVMGWREVAWICTDRWTYSIMDWDAFSRMATSGKEHVSSVSVTPGRYNVRHLTFSPYFEPHAGGTIVMYASMELAED